MAQNSTKELIFTPFSELKRTGKSETVQINGITFQIYFRGSSNPDSPFTLNVKSSETTFGTLKFIIKNSKNVKYQTRGELVKDTARPCRLRCTYKDMSFFTVNDQLTIQFSFITNEKKASPIAFSINSEAKRAIDNRMKSISYSRESTGFVGLRNGGNTCYMNSILQMLFNIPTFRRIIYNSDQNDEVEFKINIMKNLQILFYNLQTSFNVCSTAPLRVSFGWSSSDVFQEDVHEFFNLFIDKIIEKVKIDDLKKNLESLFKFKVKRTIVNNEFNFSKDLTVDVQSVLCLCINGKTDIQNMINEMKSEISYTIPNHGEKECFICETLVSLPRILLIQINRSFYNVETNKNLRINTPINYSKEIVVSDTKFELHGILNHLSRSADSGHYIAVLRPTTDENWFSFNDSCVSKISNNQVLNYKEECYMLVYVRKDVEEIEYKKVTDEEIPEKVKKIVQDANLDFIHVPFITVSSIEKVESKNVPFIPVRRKSCISIPIGNVDSTSSMYNDIRETLDLKQADKITLWKCRDNGTPVSAVPDGNEKAFQYVKNRNPIFIQNGVGKEGEILTFIKFFNSEKNEIRVLDAVCLPKTAKPSDLFNQIESSLQMKISGFAVYHESPENPNEPIQIDPSLTVDKIDKFENGSNLVFQVNKPPKINENDITSFYNGKDNFYNFFLAMLNHSVVAKLSYGEVKTVKYPCEFTISELKSFISPLIGLKNSQFILFFEENHDYFDSELNYTNENRQPLSPQSERIQTIHVKEINEHENQMRENMKSFAVYLSEDSFNVSNVFFAIELKTMKIGQIIHKYRKSESDNVRASLMISGRIQKRLDENTTIDELASNNFVIRLDSIQNEIESFLIVNIFIERRKEKIDEDEISMSFYLPIVQDEKFGQTKERIGRIAHIKENVISSLRFNLYSTHQDERSNGPPKCPNLKNDLILSDVNIPDLHIDVSRPFTSSNSHILKIYN